MHSRFFIQTGKIMENQLSILDIFLLPPDSMIFQDKLRPEAVVNVDGSRRQHFLCLKHPKSCHHRYRCPDFPWLISGGYPKVLMYTGVYCSTPPDVCDVC